MRRPHAAPYRADDLSGLRVGKANRCHNALDLVRAKYFETALTGKVSNVFVLKGGMGKKQRCTVAEAIAAVPESESRVILATGSYIGEGFDDARLDTLFLAMPISWKGTLQQYVGRVHRLHDAYQHDVLFYDMLALMIICMHIVKRHHGCFEGRTRSPHGQEGWCIPAARTGSGSYPSGISPPGERPWASAASGKRTLCGRR